MLAAEVARKKFGVAPRADMAAKGLRSRLRRNGLTMYHFKISVSPTLTHFKIGDTLYRVTLRLNNHIWAKPVR